MAVYERPYLCEMFEKKIHKLSDKDHRRSLKNQ